MRRKTAVAVCTTHKPDLCFGQRLRNPHCEVIVSLPNRLPPASTETPAVELRTAPRHRIIQRCFVRPEGAKEGEPWRCIAYDISATAIGIVVHFHLRLGMPL